MEDIRMTTVKKIIDMLKKYEGNEPVFFIMWDKDDVIRRANGRNKDVTTQQAWNILDMMGDNPDCFLHTGWDEIYHWTDWVLKMDAIERNYNKPKTTSEEGHNTGEKHD
jgi:hypothetical protein